MSRKNELFDVTLIENELTNERIPEILDWIVRALVELSEQSNEAAVSGDLASLAQFFIASAAETRLHFEARIVTDLSYESKNSSDVGAVSMISIPDSIDFVEEKGPIGNHVISVHARLNSQGLKPIMAPTESKVISDTQAEVLLAWFKGVIAHLNSRLEALE